MARARIDLVGDLVVGFRPEEMAQQQGQELREVTRERQARLHEWATDPWKFLTGRDPLDDRPIYWTRDESDETSPYKPFPEHLEYLREFVAVLKEKPRIITDKTRQMIVTTTMVGTIKWDCAFHHARRWLLSKHKEKEATEIIRDKVRSVHSRMPGWLRSAIPLKPRPKDVAEFPRTQSYIQAVAENVAYSEARGGTGNILVDEGAFQDMFGDILAAALPMATRLWACSTPKLGGPGAAVYKSYLDA